MQITEEKSAAYWGWSQGLNSKGNFRAYWLSPLAAALHTGQRNQDEFVRSQPLFSCLISWAQQLGPHREAFCFTHAAPVLSEVSGLLGTPLAAKILAPQTPSGFSAPHKESEAAPALDVGLDNFS